MFMEVFMTAAVSALNVLMVVLFTLPVLALTAWHWRGFRTRTRVGVISVALGLIVYDVAFLLTAGDTFKTLGYAGGLLVFAGVMVTIGWLWPRAGD